MAVEWGKSGRLNAGGKALEYACWGPAPSDAPTLVLLHEGLGCVALWRDFPSRLTKATNLGVVAYSRAGYGQSDPAVLPRPLDYMTREAVEILPAVLNQIGVKRAILVGHSDGATIAAIHAGSVFDPRIRGLVVMAPHFFTEPMGLKEIANAKQAYDSGGLKDRMAKYHADPDNTFRGWNDSWLNPDFKRWNVTEVLDYIRVPVLALQGVQDQYGTWAQIEVIEERCYAPIDAVPIENCHHSPFLDQPDQTVGEIADFCARLHRIETSVPKTV